MFSELFLQILIYLAVGWTAIGALALVCLLLIDWKNGKIW